MLLYIGQGGRAKKFYKTIRLEGSFVKEMLQLEVEADLELRG